MKMFGTDKRFHRKAGITARLFFAMLITILIPVLLCMVLVAQWLLQYEKDAYIRALRANVAQAAGGMAEKVELCAQTAILLAGDNSISAFLQNTAITDLYMVQEMVHVLVPKLNSANLVNKYIHQVRLIQGNTAIPDVYDVVYYSGELQGGGWRERLAAMYQPARFPSTRLYVSGVEPQTTYFRSGQRPAQQVYNLYSPIYSAGYTEIVGVVEVSVLAEDLLEGCRDLKLQNGEVLQFYAGNGECVYSSAESFPADPPDVPDAAVQWNGSRYLAHPVYIDVLDAWLILYIDDGIRVSNYYKNIVLATIGIGVLVFTFVVLSISKILSANIQVLVTAIGQIERGNLQARADVSSGDELEYLAGHINRMAARLDEFQQKALAASEAQREAMFAALENQMKPHFLCNALDFVRMNAELRDDAVVADSIYWIMSYFNYNMGSCSSFVTLKSELTNVRDYLSIYNLATQSSLELIIDVAPDMSEHLDDFVIMKYTLQPVVENAVKHAFTDRERDCFITLELGGTRCDGEDCIRICVEDNGAGMEPGACAALEESAKIGDGEGYDVKRTRNGVGLANIYRRMRLIYRTGFDLNVESYAGAGTRVTLIVPAWNREMEGTV